MKGYRGQSLIEVLVAASILGVVMIMFISTLVNLSNSQVNSRARTQAAQFAREGIEIAYNLSATDWDSFNDNVGVSVWHPEVDASHHYMLVEGEQSLSGGKFVRAISIEKAKRDLVSGNISSTGEELIGDPTLKITSVVTWNLGSADNVEFVMYLTNVGVLEEPL